MKDVKANAAGESQEVKVKVRIDHNGILFISSASMVDKREVETENGATEQNDTSGEQMDTQEVRKFGCVKFVFIFSVPKFELSFIARFIDRLIFFSFFSCQSNHRNDCNFNVRMNSRD